LAEQIKDTYDFLIAGSGFSGSVLAERLASQLNKKIFLVEKRDHIGGNAYDFYNEDGILIHKYGPHIFHTNYEDVWHYLSRFTQWNGYQHKVIAYVDGKKVPIPINLTTVNTLLGASFSEGDVKDYFESERVKLKRINNSRDVIVSQVGDFFYEKFFRNYTFKQWGVYPDELSPEVTKRIPVRHNYDDRYFSDIYQGLPVEGYSKLFERLLSNENITVVLNTDYKKIVDNVTFDRLIYTGPIDYFFDYQYGKLPYRSLNFQSETLNKEYFQEVAVVNYPNDYEFTRITEFKHMTLQKHTKTTIMKEYSAEQGEPYYPMPMEKALNIYNKNKKEAQKLKSTYFIGRLAEYKYYNMDQVIKRAFDTFESIAKDCNGIFGSI
jgi:UDP-galactopyranose mutase